MYARDVIEGRIVAGRYVRLACARHLRWLADPEVYGLRWDWEEAEIVIDFIEIQRHSKGEWAGHLLRLEPWQKFFIGNLFGWYRGKHLRWKEVIVAGHNEKTRKPINIVEDSSGTRLFRTAYKEVGRKNGKTTEMAAVGNYLLVADGEPGAEIYAAATKREQAEIMWSEARRMVEATPALKKRIRIKESVHNMHVPGTASKFEALSRDAKTADGFNPHANLVDELHAHRTREMWDVMETGMGSRRQPLQIAITTAGNNISSVAYEERDRAIKMLEGTIEADTFFAMIYTIDDGDRWDDPAVWIKANPNLGVSVKISNLIDKAQKAIATPSALSAFKTRHLCVWVGAMDGWMNMDWWKNCANPKLSIDDFEGMDCVIGLDLASRLDLAAMRIVFQDGDDYYAFGRYYLPEDTVLENAAGTHAHYVGWEREGHMIFTPGNVIDQNRIQDDIREMAAKHQVLEIAYDPYQAVKLAAELSDEGLPMVEVGSTVKNMSQPMKDHQGWVRSNTYHHDGDPVMTWMMSNVVAKMDRKENVFPNKEFPANKIDGPVAEFMAINRLLLQDSETLAPAFSYV